MSSELAHRPRASQQLATLIGMEPNAMLTAIKAQCFRGNPANITDEQLAAFVSIAAEMGVNPFLPDMLYAFPGQNGSIIPIMGPSGMYKKLMEHPDVDSWETVVYPEDVSLPPTHATTKIWRKGRERPLTYTALVSEWRMQNNPNWQNRARHMISLRSLKHCARQIIHGLPYDADDRTIMEELNVTPGEAAAPETPKIDRPPPPPRQKKGAATVAENPPKTPAEIAAVGASKVVEGDFTPAPEAPNPSPIPPVAAKAEAPAATPEPTQAAEPDAAPAAQPRAFLKADEAFTAVCEIKEVTGLSANFKGNRVPMVRAKVVGDFTGTIWHPAGGAFNADKTVVTPPPMWAVGGKVRVGLLGMAQKDAAGKPTGIAAMVETVEGVVANSEAQFG